MKKYKCPCCGYYTLREVGSDTYEICRVCHWEYDLLSLQYPDEVSGANAISLNQARENFMTFGASEERLTPFVRPPKSSKYPEER